MYKLCKTEQSSARQRELERGLLQQMCHRRFDEISVSDLCTRLGISRKSFYRYFSSKEGALFSLLDHTILDFYNNGAPGPLNGAPQEDLKKFFHFWYAKRDLLEVLYRNGLTNILVERCATMARRENLCPVLLRSESAFEQDVLLHFALCGLFAMVFSWYLDNFRCSANEMAKIAVSVLSKPLIQHI